MKDDAILVNLSRGEIVQEKPLYDHLVRQPRFTACMPGGLSQYATEGSAWINRFSTRQTSSPHRTTRRKALARMISACAAQLRTAAARWPVERHFTSLDRMNG